MLGGHAPNDGHRVVADWQRRGLVGTVVTQNVDGFHTRAGADGRAGAARHAGERALRSLRRASAPPPRSWRPAGLACACGGKMPPGRRAVRRGAARRRRCARPGTASERAPLFIVLGSSLAVAPANLLPEAAVGRGAPLVIINRDPTPLDGMATLVINAGIGETLRAVDALLAPGSRAPARRRVAHASAAARRSCGERGTVHARRCVPRRAAATDDGVAADALAPQRRVRARARRPDRFDAGAVERGARRAARRPVGRIDARSRGSGTM